MKSAEWVKRWLKTCDENGIPPWKFDFKQFYKSEMFPNADTDDTSHLKSWLKYKYTKELNKAKSNPFTDSLKKIYEDENIEKGMDKDTDKVVFPIYQVLEWQDEEKSVIKGDHMNSFLTTFTPLLLTSPTKKIPYAPFGNENKKTFNEKPKIANKLSGWAEEADSGLLNITEFEFYKEQYKIWGNFNLFARMTDTLGNFTVIPSKLNIARGSSEAFRDYWDITLRVLYDLFMAIGIEGEEAWKAFINKYFLQTYVNKDYSVGELWKGHLEDKEGIFINGVYPQKIDDFEQFYRNVNLLIEERGKWMTKILCEKLDLTNLEFYKDDLVNMEKIRFFNDIIK